MSNRNLTGKRFGKLVAVEPTNKRYGGGVVIWKCRCDCGKECEIPSTHLKDGTTKSCGCSKNEFLSKASTYTSMTRGETKANKSGKVGVRWIPSRGKWHAQIGIKENGKSKNIHLGYFYTFDDALEAREKAEKEYFTPVLNSLSM